MESIDEQFKQGDNLLQIIDRYNIQREEDRKFFLYDRKNKKYDEPQPIDILKDILIEHNCDIDADSFIYTLSNLRICRTFWNLAEAEEIENGFNGYKIIVPMYVRNCIKEIRLRSDYIDSFINKEKYKWSNNDLEIFDKELKNLLEENSYDLTSRLNILKELFDKTRTQINEIQDLFEREYEYSIHDFYNGDTFNLNIEDLNFFFYECEKIKNGTDEFRNIYLHFEKYIKRKNKLKELKRLIIESSLEVQDTNQQLKFSKRAFVTSVNDTTESSSLGTLELSDVFEHVSKCHYIKNLLVEQGLCQPNTFIWKTIVGSRGFLAGVLKYLHLQGYYKDNKALSSSEIKIIAKNTFGVQIGIDRIKQVAPSSIELKFIPLASTIK
ncbi:hypothetical protein [Adhaeribacter pallidiroseus]|uniref:Uncharacterized protein n=1 Tax=Adhaeribacter pallidiroseus TaxID=2072847 RepID=A0A369QI90_9BACT|nr:hypothetical protein [Adhaeribacter pallidiroseus]RDC64611.1 hypothetical protein AHMF7616_03227 [Adhaeribacter pallidiroseus]